MKIRPYRASDLDPLIEVWLRSVRATHHFLSEEDIAFLLPLIREGPWSAMETWMLETEEGELAGIMSLAEDRMEALFLAPECLHQGQGTRLVNHAKKMKRDLFVDVNEQNQGACAFYEACGFTAFSRSVSDAQGKPFPLIHMKFSPPD